MRACKVDDNQKQIVDALRKIGCSVQHLHKVGQGCPDLLVGYMGKNWLLEIKRNAKSPLTKDQVEWHGTWRGDARV